MQFTYAIHLLFLLLLFHHTLQHAWEEPIWQFIESLETSGAEGPFWVCAFSIFQNHNDNVKPTIAEQLGPNPEYGPFTTVLRQVDLMLAVVTALCDIYTRLWYVQPNELNDNDFINENFAMTHNFNILHSLCCYCCHNPQVCL